MTKKIKRKEVCASCEALISIVLDELEWLTRKDVEQLLKERLKEFKE